MGIIAERGCIKILLMQNKALFLVTIAFFARCGIVGNLNQ